MGHHSLNQACQFQGPNPPCGSKKKKVNEKVNNIGRHSCMFTSSNLSLFEKSLDTPGLNYQALQVSHYFGTY